jgi:hypothetical protein
MDGAEFLAFVSKLVTAYNNLKMKFWVWDQLEGITNYNIKILHEIYEIPYIMNNKLYDLIQKIFLMDIKKLTTPRHFFFALFQFFSTHLPPLGI